jgi:hypothetical protein
MASQKWKVGIELWYCESNCVIAVQRRYCGKFGKQPSLNHSSRKWCNLFTERGWICKWTSRSKRPINQERVNAVRAAFVQPLPSNLSKGFEMLTNVWAELEYTYTCRATNDAPVERL